MIPAPIPEDEARRLELLRLYRILDTPPEEVFDRITRIVAETIDVPIALVSLVDQERQWFKSKYGLEASQTPRELAFCAHAILGKEVFVIEDASEDVRFFDNPLVESDPSIKFYAGAPLITNEGLNLGTLCAIDRRPRKLSKKHRMLLQDLAHLVIDEMELRLALQKSMADAAEVSRQQEMRNQFLANVSHELRTPLTSIKGALGLLEHGLGGKLPKKAQELILVANRNSNNLINLINDLLDIQKLDADKLEFDFTTVAIEELLKESCENLHGYAVENKVIIDLVCPKLPSIIADPYQLNQAVANLISNAIKFTPPNGSVTVSGERQDDNICLKVTDRGAGIPAKFQSSLFDRFTQASSSNKTKGTGLGLAITKKIVESHNGIISFDTSPSRGTTFCITIPIKQTLANNKN